MAPASPPQQPPAFRWSSLPLLLGLATCWASTYPLTKIGLEGGIPPFTFICWRSFLAGLILLVWLTARGLTIPVNRASLSLFTSQQLINSTIPFLLITWSQQFVPATITVVLASTTPIFAFLITWGITRHEPATLRKFLGVVVGLAGTLVIIGFEALQGLGQQLLAQLLTTIATISFAFGSIYGRRLNAYDPMIAAGGSLLMGGVIMLPVSLIVEKPWQLAPTPSAWIALAAIAFFSSALGLMLFYKLLAAVGSIGTNAQAYLRIPIGVALSVILLGEAVPPHMLAGVVLVFAGVLAMTLPERRRR